MNLELILEKTKRAVDIENAMTEVLHKIDRLFELEENEDVKLKLGAISSLVFDVRREYMVLFEEMERDVKI